MTDPARMPVGYGVELLGDDRICWHIKAGHGFEPATLALWASWCMPGIAVCDVGAYSGLFSIIAAKRGARVIAVEPMPVMVGRIRENAALNDVEIDVIEAVAADRPGTMRLGYNEGVHLTSGASLKHQKTPLTVRSVMLNSLVGIGFSAIKIDVEGAELDVLRGARLLLDRCQPRLIIETLTSEARAAVLAELGPGYKEADFLDTRNLVVLPA